MHKNRSLQIDWILVRRRVTVLKIIKLTSEVEAQRKRSGLLPAVLIVLSRLRIDWILVRRRVTRRLTRIQSIRKLRFLCMS